MYMIRNEERGKAQYSLNLFMQINFTGGNRSAKVLGTGSLDERESKEQRLLAHFTFAHLVRPCHSKDWCDFATCLTNYIFNFIPNSMIHWKSEWHDLEVCTDSFDS